MGQREQCSHIQNSVDICCLENGQDFRVWGKHDTWLRVEEERRRRWKRPDFHGILSAKKRNQIQINRSWQFSSIQLTLSSVAGDVIGGNLFYNRLCEGLQGSRVPRSEQRIWVAEKALKESFMSHDGRQPVPCGRWGKRLCQWWLRFEPWETSWTMRVLAKIADQETARQRTHIVQSRAPASCTSPCMCLLIHGQHVASFWVQVEAGWLFLLCT